MLQHSAEAQLRVKMKAKPRCSLGPVFKIEVLNAFQMRFGASKYTYLKTTLQNATPN